MLLSSRGDDDLTLSYASLFLDAGSTANPSPSQSSMLSLPLNQSSLISLPPPKSSPLYAFLSTFLPRRYFKRADPTEGLLTARPSISQPSVSTGVASSPGPKWIGGGPNVGGGLAGGGESSASMRRVASATHLAEDGHELPDVTSGAGAGSGLNPNGAGSGKSWGTLSSKSNRGGGEMNGRSLPQRSTTGGFDMSRGGSLEGVGSGVRKTS